jgi:hypothetical protein
MSARDRQELNEEFRLHNSHFAVRSSRPDPDTEQQEDQREGRKGRQSQRMGKMNQRTPSPPFEPISARSSARGSFETRTLH